MKVYNSPFPDIPVPNESIFTNLFTTHEHDYPSSAAAYIDAATGRVVSRGMLKELCLSFAWGLRNHLVEAGGPTLDRGDTVMIFSPNSIAWPIALLGSVAAGLRCTLANSSYVARELEHQYTDSGAKVILVHAELLPVTLEMFRNLGVDRKDAKGRIIVADWGVDSVPQSAAGFMRMSDLVGRGSLDREELFSGEQVHETVYLCYSSGTTGKPKGVETTHRNMTAVTSMINAAYPQTFFPQDLILGVLPFYHIYGCAAFLHFALLRATPVIIMSKFDPVDFCRYIEKYRVTHVNVVPPMCVVFLRHPAILQHNLKSLRFLFCSAAPLSGTLVDSLRKRFQTIGIDMQITQGYGLTETSPTTHILDLPDSLQKVGSVGQLLPTLSARIMKDDEADADDGEPGELWLRGPTIMKGYRNNVKATRESVTPEGWFKTGDIAVRDSEGFYYIVERRKELIKYKGFQVAPAELEAVLLTHPDIVDVGVIGLKSEEEATELPRAYLVTGRKLDSVESRASFGREVQTWMETRVARHKYLRGGVVVVDSIPKSPSGKILRRELRIQAEKEHAGNHHLKPKL